MSSDTFSVLPQALVPLSGHARRHLALLGQATRVHGHSAGVAKMNVRIGDQLPSDVAPFPFRFTEHVMQLLVRALCHGFSHTLQVTAGTLELAPSSPLVPAFGACVMTRKALLCRPRTRIWHANG